MTSACRVCKFDVDEANLLPAQARYVTRICRMCRAEQQRKADQSPSGKASRRNWQLKRRYGISHQDYLEMVAAQDGKCKICPRPATECFHGLLHVDHDHSTGKVRGLLCHLCNTVLGKMNDDPALLRKAADYIESGV